MVSTDPEKQHPVNVHHIPICTTFYFLSPNVLGNTPGKQQDEEDQRMSTIASEEPFIDASAKEERLCAARLSIVMNVFEDLCGMSTLGQMQVDPSLVLKCAKQALTVAKETTT